MLNYQQALIESTSRIRDAGSQTPELDALLLLCKATGVDRMALYTTPRKQLTTEEYNKFEGLVGRREKAEPIAISLVKKGFGSLHLK